MRPPFASLALALALSLASCRAVTPAAQTQSGPRRELEFAGATSFPTRELESAVQLDFDDLARRSSPRSALDDAAYSLVEFYRSRGYPECAVDYSLVESTPLLLRARFEVVEGPHATLERVDFVGLGRLERDELLAVAGLDESGQPFVASTLAGAVETLVDHYASKGFLDARIDEPELGFDESRTHVRATFHVHEGVRYRLAHAPRLEGGVPGLDALVESDDLVGKPLAPGVALDLRGRIEEVYAQNGHPDVDVQRLPSKFGADGSAELAFRIAPGPRVVISGVRVNGNEKTRESFVRAHVRLGPGEAYDVRKVRESFRDLYRTGLFTRVRVDLEPGAGELRELRVELEEAPSTELFVEPGYGSYEHLRALFGWREKNLFGSGRSLQIEGLLAERAQRWVAGVSEPRLFDSEVSSSVSVFREVRQEPSFDTDERGAALVFSRDLSPRLRLSCEYRFKRSDVSNVDVNDPLALDQLNEVDISSVAVGSAWDSRNGIFAPSHGLQLKASAELANQALGSELEFVRLKGTVAQFVELTEGRVLGLSWRTGAIAPIDSTTTIPLQERFFNGGENTVRSFREDQLGPKDADGEPFGGEAYNVLSAELRQRLRGALEGALFADAGNVSLKAADVLAFEDLRYALGVGLRYLLPIGPVRLDAGWNPDPRDDEDTWAVHFSVGMSF